MAQPRVRSRGFLLAMLSSAALAASCLAVVQPAVGQAVETSSSGDELSLGVAAYKQAHYEEAIAHFRRATEIAPDSLMAKTYLGTALAQNVVPGLDTPENLKMAQQAIDTFQQVLAANPHDVNSLKQVAGIYYYTKRLDEARDWQKKVLDENPSDADAAYTIGVIDWTQAHQHALKALAEVNVQDDGEGNVKAPPGVLESIRVQNAELVAEALKYLNEALSNRPNYDNAMTYMNLVYRRKADIDFADPRLRDEDIAVAKAWTHKAMATRKANEEQKSANQVPNQN